AVPAPPHLCVHRPVVGSAGQRVPDHPVVAGVRQRRARGPGHRGSRQKLFYLPESHTDLIFAIIGEELGFVGATAIVGLFVALIWRGLRIGLRAPDAFSGYLALGITVLIATQTLVNLGVVTGLLPTKGLPLPFIW